MNDLLKAYAKKYLKESLAKCTPNQVMLFKRMYSHTNLEADIDAVVEFMPDDKLDWAMQQVQRTLERAKQ